MKVPTADLHAQYMSLKHEIDSAIANVIKKSAFIGSAGNEFVREFEESFAEYSGAQYCVGCANGTDALEISLRAAGIGRGDEVIVPAMTWIATSEAVSNVGATPVFSDIVDGTHTIDPVAAESVITPDTKAIIPVHLYGLSADMDSVMELARTHELFVLEDCAQAHGAEYKGRPVGTIGHAGSFSFFPGKNLGAFGDAGAIISNDLAFIQRARTIGQHGQAQEKFRHKIEGRNSRIDGIQAAVLRVKLERLDTWTERRIRIASQYQELLSGADLLLPTCPADMKHVYHLFPIEVTDRDGTRSRLAEAGISSGIQYPTPLPLLEAYARRGLKPSDFPVAHSFSQKVLTLPIFPEMQSDQVEYVAKYVAA